MRYRIPYSDLASIGEDERLALYGSAASLEFGHSLSDQIGGQIEAGFMLTDLVEDSRPGLPLSAYIDEYIATRAVRM